MRITAVWSSLRCTLCLALFLVVSAAHAEQLEASAPDDTAGVGEAILDKARPLLKAMSLLGTPYRLGGNRPEQGLDCSGFVRHVYREASDITLPRTARDMSRAGRAIERDELRPGDLVFFNTRNRPFSHVGIYAGNGEFVHASSRAVRRVTVSRLTDRYWSSRFNGARRVLAAP